MINIFKIVAFLITSSLDDSSSALLREVNGGKVHPKKMSTHLGRSLHSLGAIHFQCPPMATFYEDFLKPYHFKNEAVGSAQSHCMGW